MSPFSTGTADTAVFIGEPNWIYNPTTQGAVISISGGIDRLTNFTGSLFNGLRLAILQNNAYFFINQNKGPFPSGATSGQYYPLTSGPLTSTSFGEYTLGGFNSTPDFTQHPDFSTSFELGYLILASPSGPQFVTSAFFDNLNFTITATPLPSTWLMLLSGFVGLGFFAYRGTKKNAAALAV